MSRHDHPDPPDRIDTMKKVTKRALTLVQELIEEIAMIESRVAHLEETGSEQDSD